MTKGTTPQPHQLGCCQLQIDYGKWTQAFTYVFRYARQDTEEGAAAAAAIMMRKHAAVSAMLVILQFTRCCNKFIGPGSGGWVDG